MIVNKKYSYGRSCLETRECPVCHFSCDLDVAYGTRFKQLKINCKDEFGEDIRLHACPKCGTIGVDVYESEYCD